MWPNHGKNAARPSGAPGLQILQLIIVSVQQDILTCQDVWGNTVYIAKPPLLRATAIWTSPRSVNGQAYTIVYSCYSSDGQERTATRSSDSSTETQEVDDSYQVDDPIFAINMITLDQDGNPLKDINSNPVQWQDMNIDARHWAMKATS